MSILSIGVRGKILGMSRFSEALPNIIQMFESIENWANGRIGSDNIAALSVGTSELIDGSVTTAKIADKVGRTNDGQYTGDGTVDREINVGFRPRRVWLFRHDTSMVFESIGSSGGPYLAGRRTNAGAWTGSGVLDADFQGASANGILLGHAAGGGLSNAVGQTYSWFVQK